MEITIQEKKQQKQQKKGIDYDDILQNMGMREVKGKLYWEKTINDDLNYVEYDTNTQQQRYTQQHIQQQQYKQNNQQNVNNSYIYNKYFKNEINNDSSEFAEQPRNIIEYRNMLIRQMIERKKIQQIKSTKMMFQK